MTPRPNAQRAQRLLAQVFQRSTAEPEDALIPHIGLDIVIELPLKVSSDLQRLARTADEHPWQWHH
jgi:hypothetical protein